MGKGNLFDTVTMSESKKQQNYREGLAYDGPSSWMLRLASHWPRSMLCSKDLFWTIPATKPPAKASLCVGKQKSQQRSLCVSEYQVRMNIPSTVCIVDFLLRDLVNWVFLRFYGTAGSRDCGDSRQSSLCDNDDTRTLGILLLEGSELLGNLSDVGDTPAMVLGEGKSFGLVANKVVNVRNHAIELVLEELRDEGSREGEDERLYRITY